MAAILTIDLGTTFFKVCLFDDSGTLRGVARVAPAITHPQPQLWELPVPAMEQAVAQGIAELARQLPDLLGAVAAISFASQANSFALLDESGQPLGPFLLWPDSRQTQLPPALAELSACSRPTTGVPALATQFAVAKLHFLRERQPELYARARRLCFISDYLTLWFTGEHCCEAGIAGLSGMLDIHTVQWWPQALAAAQVDPAWLGRPVRAGSLAGRLRPETAQRLGLAAGIPVYVGCLDQYAGVLGAGAAFANGMAQTTGTVLASVRCTPRFDLGASQSVYYGPGVSADLYYAMTFGSTAGNLLQWYQQSLPDQPGFEDLAQLARKVTPGAGGLLIEPYEDGQPMEESFRHVTPGHSRGQVVRAIMEAVARALKDQVTALGAPLPEQIRSAGGAARSDLWLQIKADTLGVPVAATACPEPTSLGAALLAGSGLGWAKLPDLMRTWVKVRAVFAPMSAASNAPR